MDIHSNRPLGIAWSSQADFNVVPAPALDASLLAVGTRAGILFFLRWGYLLQLGALTLTLKVSYQPDSENLVCVDKIKIAKNGLTHLAFSRWSLVRQGKCRTSSHRYAFKGI